MNRRRGTARRYKRVLKTVSLFFSEFHPGVHLLRDIRPFHIEDYKRRPFNGQIIESKSTEELEQERRLRQELELRHRSGQTIDKGKYGWLGRWPIQPKVAQKTINYELQCLQTFLQWAIRQNYLFSNPASAIEHFRIPKKSIPKFVTSDDLKRFFDACNPEERRIFATMLLTGMRKGEMENLTWEDVQFELSIIFIQAKKDWNPKSDERIIPKFQVMRHSNASLGGIRTRKKAVLY